jgi:hypothetical protein
MLTLDDGDGEVSVWLQKVNGVEAAEMTRRCDAARSRVMAATSGDEAWEATLGTVRDYVAEGEGGKERLVDFLLLEKRGELQRSHELKLANEEEWSKDNYIQGLYDAWRDDLEKRWIVDQEDAEAAKCKEELDRFAAAATEEVDAELELFRESWAQEPEDQLQHRMASKLLEMDAGQAWIAELWACQIYYGTREPDDKMKRYFIDREEVDLLSPRTFEALHEAYQTLEVDVAEGKGSPAPTSSSLSSGDPDAVVTEPSSGLLGASR